MYAVGVKEPTVEPLHRLHELLPLGRIARLLLLHLLQLDIESLFLLDLRAREVEEGGGVVLAGDFAFCGQAQRRHAGTKCKVRQPGSLDSRMSNLYAVSRRSLAASSAAGRERTSRRQMV